MIATLLKFVTDVSYNGKKVYCLSMTVDFRNIISIGLIDTASSVLTGPELRNAAYGLLSAMATELAGIPATETKTVAAPAGKPYFNLHPQLHFSLSHSGPLAACALGFREVGLDIEVKKTQRSWREIAGRFFADEEVTFLEQQGDGALEAFYQLWTRKESWLKVQGLAVWQIGRAHPTAHNHSTGLFCRTWEGTGSVRFSLSLSVKAAGADVPVEFPERFLPKAIALEEVPAHFFPVVSNDH